MDVGFLCSKVVMLDVAVKRKSLCIISDSYVIVDSGGEVKMGELQCKW